MHDVCTHVEGAGSAEEHVAHDMLPASGKYKLGIVAVLYVCAQKGFNIIFPVFVYLLKLINGDDAGLIGFFQVFEYFIQCFFR